MDLIGRFRFGCVGEQRVGHALRLGMGRVRTCVVVDFLEGFLGSHRLFLHSRIESAADELESQVVFQLLELAVSCERA